MGLLAQNIGLFNQLETEAIEARGEAAKYLDPDYSGYHEHPHRLRFPISRSEQQARQ